MALILIKDIESKMIINKKGKRIYYKIYFCTFCENYVERRIDGAKKCQSCGCVRSILISKSNKGKIQTEETKHKIREGNLGKIISEKTRQKQSEIRKGKYKGKNNPFYGKKHSEASLLKRKKNLPSFSLNNNPNWQGGKSFEIYPKEFKQVKKFILERDNYICQNPYCMIDIPKRLDCHHIDYNKNNNNPENLTTLCISCHMKTNYNREYFKQFYINLINERMMQNALE